MSEESDLGFAGIEVICASPRHKHTRKIANLWRDIETADSTWMDVPIWSARARRQTYPDGDYAEAAAEPSVIDLRLGTDQKFRVQGVFRCRCGENFVRNPDVLFPVLELIREAGMAEVSLQELRLACERFQSARDR